jgi:hypothetical protein
MTLPIPRRKVPLATQLAAALDQLGLTGTSPELDHVPALALRKVNAALGDYDPPQLDPQYLRWRGKAEHRIKTSGTKATSAGSDIWKIAHGKRLTQTEEEFCRRMLAKEPGKSPRPASRWPKRSFGGRAWKR